MKVAFDEHVPIELVKTFEGLAKIKKIQRAAAGLEFSAARQYAPKINKKDFIRGSDVPWLDRFASLGGKSVISGDVKMKQNPHELLTLQHHGFVVVFFESTWGNWDFYKKTGLMVHWWPVICQKIKNADRGTHWVVPNRWPVKPDDSYELRNVSTGLLQLLADRKPESERLKNAKPKPSKRPKSSKSRRGPDGQEAFQYEAKPDE